MSENPAVWGPHFWYFLHYVTQTYPLQNPSNTLKKKYYEFVMNIPIFLPPEYASNFVELLDKYPVAPYLDTRNEFARWMHFIHNKINVQLKKQKVDYLGSKVDYSKVTKVIQPSHILLSAILTISLLALSVFLYVYYS